MKTFKIIIISLMALSILSVGCKNMNRTKKGAVIGAASGGAIGAVIGRASGNTALGALIGATVGGATGAVIGRKMDRQAEDIKNTVVGAKVYRVGEGIIVEFNDKVLFGFDKSDLNEGSKASIDKLVVILDKYPDTNIEIQGHTDNSGTDKYNMNLSKRRASAVSYYLMQKSISSRRLLPKDMVNRHRITATIQRMEGLKTVEWNS